MRWTTGNASPGVPTTTNDEGLAQLTAAQEGNRTLRTPHNPKILLTADGRWVLTCPECEASRQPQLPIGIRMPLESRLTAERLRENHMGRKPTT
jgi:hypothetical protein